MRLIILTQEDPFYLAENLDYLLKNIPEGTEVVSCVVFDASPFGKKLSFFQKIVDTYKIMGNRFMLWYGTQFILNKFNPNKDVIKTMKKHGIEVIKLEKGINHQSSLDVLRGLKPDLLISIAGNQIFKKTLIDLAPKGCINLHTALLPKYRGLMPSFWVLKNNEKETAASIFFVDEGIDSGPIIVQKKIPISPTMTQNELIVKSKKIGMDAIIESIKLIKENKVELIPNPAEEMTYFSFPTRKDVREFYKNGRKFF